MEDLEDPGTPILDNTEEPEALADPDDPLRPEIEEEHEPNPPISDPTADPDALQDDARDDQPEPDNDPALDVDDESELDELDEAQFDNFDPSAANIVVPVAIDETNVNQLGVHKRKRTEEEERERKKKKKEGRRERVSKKSKKREDVDLDTEEVAGKRSRGRTAKPAKRDETPEDEETLPAEERRRRALERKMDEALRTNKPSRRKGPGIDVQDQGEAELEMMRIKMAEAAQKDNNARKNNEPASHKLLLLPKVVELLNRNTLKQAILDPDINILEAVRFFLEPADVDAALPNYQIQREMFKVLSGLRMTKEALIASGIGKVVMYYTKSNQPQPAIKHQAERLMQGWMSVVLNRKRSSKLQQLEKRQFDPITASQRAAANASQFDRATMAEERRRKALQLPGPENRARVEGGLNTYKIAPVNNMSNQALNPRRMGAGGEETFKRLAAKSQIKGGGVSRK